MQIIQNVIVKNLHVFMGKLEEKKEGVPLVLTSNKH